MADNETRDDRRGAGGDGRESSGPAGGESQDDDRAADGDRFGRGLAYWSLGVIVALLVAVFGTLLLALKQEPPEQNGRSSRSAEPHRLY